LSLKILAIATFALLVMGCLAIAWRQKPASPGFWHPLFLGVMAIGTFQLIDFSHPSDWKHIVAFFVGLIVFSFTFNSLAFSAGADRLAAAFIRKPIEPESPAVTRFIFFILILSILITIIYYSATGANMFLLIMRGVEVEDYSTLRLSMYSGEKYFAPGYVNQFKNVLLPLSLTVVGLWLHRKKSSLRWVFWPFAAFFWTFAVMGTGQRAFLVFSLMATIFGLRLAVVRNQVKKKQPPKLMYFVVGGCSVALFLAFTQAYQGATISGGSSAIELMFARLLFIQQEGGLIGFRYIADFEPRWFGDWLDALVGIFPGQPGSRIDHDIHALMYGSDRGTVPLSIIGTAYYNAGMLGVVLLYACFGTLASMLYVRFLKGAKTTARCLSYGGCFFYASVWVAGSPVTLLDNGCGTLIILSWLASNVRRRSTVKFRKLRLNPLSPVVGRQRE
jgi:oligosaccharide repeat unit polymerase